MWYLSRTCSTAFSQGAPLSVTISQSAPQRQRKSWYSQSPMVVEFADLTAHISEYEVHAQRPCRTRHFPITMSSRWTRAIGVEGIGTVGGM